MTKVQARYELQGELSERLLEAIDRAHGIYGLHRVQVEEAGDSLLVDYDASRLMLTDVDNALRSAGLRVVRKG